MPRLPTSPFLIPFQFHLTGGFAFGHVGTCFHDVHARHLALRGLTLKLLYWNWNEIF